MKRRIFTVLLVLGLCVGTASAPFAFGGIVYDANRDLPLSLQSDWCPCCCEIPFQQANAPEVRFDEISSNPVSGPCSWFLVRRAVLASYSQ